MTRARLGPALLAAALVATMSACGRSVSNDGSLPTTVSPSTVAPTTLAPSATTALGPPVTGEPRSFVFGPITFHIPPDWITTPDGPVAYIGENAGKVGTANLRVMLEYPGTVDGLRPPECLGSGTTTAAPPAGVEVVESGFAPVGEVTAEFRHWRFDCPGSEITVEDHRVWLLPSRHVAIVEQRHSPDVLDVVRTAEIA